MKKSNSKFKTFAIVALTNIIVIAAAAGIALGVNAVKNPEKSAEEKSPYTVKVNEATGEEEFYNKNGELAYKVNKEYNAENKKLEKEVYADKNNKTTKIVYYKDDAKTIDRVDEYDKDDNIAVERVYENGKATGEYWKFDYDEQGRICNSVNYDGNDNVIMKKEESHNKDGKPVVFQETDGNGNLISKTEYTYDEKGNEIKAVFYSAEGMTGYVEYEYGADGRVSRMNQYKGDKLIEYRLFKYDKNGSCTQEIHDASDLNK